MKMIKCFDTDTMPDNVYYRGISELFHSNPSDTCDFWIVDDDDNDPPCPTIQWFLDNGGEYGEHVIIERGSWRYFYERD